MSLDVWLTVPDDTNESDEPELVILIRENGSIREISRDEWNKRFPGQEPVMVNSNSVGENIKTVFDGNITHNLSRMADEAVLYLALWRPEDLSISHLPKAKDLIFLLESGLAALKERPDFYRQFNPKNGWGTYEGLVDFVERYLDACKAYPDADVHASR